jgi:hypothetical protein
MVLSLVNVSQQDGGTESIQRDGSRQPFISAATYSNNESVKPNTRTPYPVVLGLTNADVTMRDRHDVQKVDTLQYRYKDRH